MKYILYIFLLSTQLFSSDIKILVSQNCDIKSLTHFEIKEIFLKTRTRINNINIIPLDNKKIKTQKEFMKKYMNKNPYQMKSYWVRMIFTGNKTPPLRIDLNKFKQDGKCYISYTKKKDKIPIKWKIANIND